MSGTRIQRPADLERLWDEAEPLHAGDLPPWLAVEDASLYRRVASRSATELPPEEREGLEAAGIVVDASGVYVRNPTTEPVFAIGIYEGRSPHTLLPAALAANPVLSRDDVSDVAASSVADPFVIRTGSVWHMFFEVYNWRRNKGEIGHATSGDGLQWAYHGIVLAEPFHLSYPYVFEWDGDHYLVPESFQAGGVRLYRAGDFPGDWTVVGELLSLPYAVDASPFRFDGYWWLLVGTSVRDEHDTLRLYLADHLLGPWREHPRSPVVSADAASARPAGRVLVDGARVIRFAQDCSSEYGAAVRAFEIVELTPIVYVDREVLPRPLLTGSGTGWNAGGMHHIDVRVIGDSWLAAVDGWRKPERAAGGS